MKLLTPEKVKTDKKRSEEERQSRIKQLNKAESEATASLNSVLSNAKTQEEMINSHLVVVEQQANERKSALLKEIGSLENHRRELLKPIDEIKREVEAREQEVAKKEAKIEQEKLKIAEQWDLINEDIDNLADYKQTLDEREAELTTREKGIYDAEERIKKSAQSIQEKWVIFHKDVHALNSDFIAREANLTAREKALNARSQEVSRMASQNEQDRRAIKDGYESLERAKEEILSKDYGKRHQGR